MTQEEFIKVLDKKGYSYEMMGDSVVVNGGDSEGVVYLESLTSLPPGVVFKNEWDVNLRSLTSLPRGVEFKNVGGVILSSLTSIPRGVVFKNVGNVYLGALISLPPGVEFRNEGVVYLDALIGGRFSKWSGNIKGIDSKRLLNSMISKGLFER
jgi:hypothetical protein